MNTFQFISSVGGAGAPGDNEENEGFSGKKLLEAWCLARVAERARAIQKETSLPSLVTDSRYRRLKVNNTSLPSGWSP